MRIFLAFMSVTVSRLGCKTQMSLSGKLDMPRLSEVLDTPSSTNPSQQLSLLTSCQSRFYRLN